MVAFDTVYPADSLEFCPIVGHQDIFVCGTYKLQDEPGQAEDDTENRTKTPQMRNGKCLTFRVSADTVSGISCQQIQSFDLPAILDMKWCHRSEQVPPTLGIADSEGNITIHEWREQSFKALDSINCASKETLCLSLDWSNRRIGGRDLGSLVVSLSNGNLSIFSPIEGSTLGITDTWHAHDYEPWIAAWNYWDNNVIYSGGDDLKLKGWDIRQGFTRPTFVNKQFEAGVTSIQSHPYIEHLIAIGSYNNTVQLFDARKMSASLAQVDVGGGAWRVKWCPNESRKHDLLVACMHDGFKVIRFDTSSDVCDGASPGIESVLGTSQIVKRFDEHESMAYGADWSYGAPLNDGSSVIGGCSFYDHKMSLWTA